MFVNKYMFFNVFIVCKVFYLYLCYKWFLINIDYQSSGVCMSFIQKKYLAGLISIGLSSTMTAATLEAKPIDKVPSTQVTCRINFGSGQTKQYIEQKTMTVPDQHAVHDLRLGHTEQKITDATPCLDQRLMKKNAYFMVDNIDLDGYGTGYNIFETQKGDKIFVKTSAVGIRRPGDDFTSKMTVGVITGGTGIFTGASGQYKAQGHDNRHSGASMAISQTLVVNLKKKDA